MEKMTSKELGLLLGKYLFDIQDLHYGLWDDDIDLKIGNIAIAQQRYTDLLLSKMESWADNPERILDIGCGTGNLLIQLLEKGYLAEGLTPLNEITKENQSQVGKNGNKTLKIYETKFEDFHFDKTMEKYDVAIFSESFQYMQLNKVFTKLEEILKPNGIVLIFDFFKVNPTGEANDLEKVIGGGHRLRKFYERVDQDGFQILEDLDLTEKIAPNMKLLNDVLMRRFKPSIDSLDTYMNDNYPWLNKLIKKVLGKKFAKINKKYFSGDRNEQVFSTYKSYRLLALKMKTAKNPP